MGLERHELTIKSKESNSEMFGEIKKEKRIS
jgi:hypothetical protein